MNPVSTPLEDYALLADLHTGPLVSREGSIDWLCFPRFDSPAVFCAILGDEDNGHWKLGAVDGEVVSRRYVEDTFVLETEWRTPTGRVLVTDFLPPSDDHANLVRRVRGLEGSVEVEHDLKFRFDYGKVTPWVRRVTLDPQARAAERTHKALEGAATAASDQFRQHVQDAIAASMADRSPGEGLQAIAGPDSLLLTGPELEPYDHGHRGRFTVEAGAELDWVLSWTPSYHQLPVPTDPARAQRATEAFWRSWCVDVESAGEYGDHQRRSLMVLRALTHSETGGLVAAPTASLPEDFGGERNWDYRYTWLRDAALTIEVMVEHGHTEGALEWRNWLLRAVAGDPEHLQIMYGIDGRRDLAEKELDHLAGYENSRPVRIGNGAVDQYQADVAGEVMIALAQLRDAGVKEDDYSWGLQVDLLTYCEMNFDKPDHGIWEMRGDKHFFTHGRVMMWAAFNEGIRAVEQHGLKGDVQRWRELREKLHHEIWERGFNSELGIFTQTYTNTEVDASLLQLPHTGFVRPDDPAMLATVERIEKDLQGPYGQVWRYRTDQAAEGEAGMDGLSGHEYPFVICTFWLAEQYARSGRVADARELMETTVGFANDVGLLSEEYDPTAERLAGNFPQAFSHLGLIRAADALQQSV